MNMRCQSIDRVDEAILRLLASIVPNSRTLSVGEVFQGRVITFERIADILRATKTSSMPGSGEAG